MIFGPWERKRCRSDPTTTARLPTPPPSSATAPPRRAGQVSRPVPTGPVESYDLGGDEIPETAPTPVRPPVAANRPARPKPPAPRDVPTQREYDEDEDDDEEASVDEVWTRWAEWGPTVIRLGITATATVALTYFVGGSLGFGWAFLILVLGMATFVLMSYPIAVTLERPVRMTPEQAVKDFYGAAAHHFPQYPRMWALLSSEGRESPEFDSFASFRTYWRHTLTKIKGSSVKGTTPLAFKVADFDSDKSAGQTFVEAKYKLIVTARDSDAVLAEYRVETSLVKGPDRMWYLNRGDLPQR